MFPIWILESCLQIWLFKVEVKFTWHNVNHFEVNSSVAFSVFTVVCNHYLCLFQIISIIPRGNSILYFKFDLIRSIYHKNESWKLITVPNVTLACLSFRITWWGKCKPLGPSQEGLIHRWGPGIHSCPVQRECDAVWVFVYHLLASTLPTLSFFPLPVSPMHQLQLPLAFYVMSSFHTYSLKWTF